MVKKKKLENAFVLTVVIVLTVILIFPILLVFSASFSDDVAFADKGYAFIPSKFSLESFQYIFNSKTEIGSLLWRSFFNSVLVSLSGMFVGITVCTLTAYVLSKKYLKGIKGITLFFLITMFFNGGLIPTYLVMRKIGLYDNIWILILPCMANVYNIVLMRSYFYGLPRSMEEAAQLDGANDFQILWKIYLPLSLPMIATIAFFIFIDRWNSWMDAKIYLRDKHYSLWTLPYFINQLMTQENIMSETSFISKQPLQCACIVVAITPLLILFPILNKYFISGYTVGAVKE